MSLDRGVDQSGHRSSSRGVSCRLSKEVAPSLLRIDFPHPRQPGHLDEASRPVLPLKRHQRFKTSSVAREVTTPAAKQSERAGLRVRERALAVAQSFTGPALWPVLCSWSAHIGCDRSFGTGGETLTY